MDGHFVDNISFGPPVIESIAKIATVPLDAHLMVERPDHFFPRFTPFVDNITIHVEPHYDIAATLKGIRAAGSTCGLAINPPTPFEKVEPYLDQIDLLLVMTVNPGFGGQSFMEAMMAKVERAAKLRAERGLDFHIEVDGGIYPNTAAIARRAGANVLVAGTGLSGLRTRLWPSRSCTIHQVSNSRFCHWSRSVQMARLDGHWLDLVRRLPFARSRADRASRRIVWPK